jgi:hypothetical protein
MKQKEPVTEKATGSLLSVLLAAHGENATVPLAFSRAARPN